MKKYYLLLLLFLFACNSQDTPFPKCISADDFSTLGTTIGANVREGSELFIADNKESADGFNPDQVVRWQSTGFITNGDPLVIRTNGAWSAWLDDGNKTSTTDKKLNNKFRTQSEYGDQISLSSISHERICGPYPQQNPGGKCGAARKCSYIELNNPKDNTSAKQYGPPCWFKDGYGAYILLKRPDDKSPNATLDIMRTPISPVVHIGYDGANGAGAFSSQDHPFLDDSCQTIQLEAGWEIYVKILDRFYWNDAGGYAFEFIKGVVDHKKTRVLESIRAAVQKSLIDNGAGKIFQRITQDNQYINFVKALLALYIAFTGIAFMFGMVQQAYSDAIIRIIKIAIVMQLISPDSWEFFYNNLIVVFVDGTAHVIGIINNFSGRAFDPSKPFESFDVMLDILFSGTVWRAKAIAYTWTNPAVAGWLAVLVILIIIISYTIIMIRACVVYLINMIGISILITLFPLFLLATLFAKLPVTFDNWLKQMMGFCFKSILTFTLVALFAAIIMNFYYRAFGFTTCYNTGFKLEFCAGKLGCATVSTIPSWTFGQKYDPYRVGGENHGDLGTQNRSTFTAGTAFIKIPPDYKQEGCRYVDYPFFDPQFNVDAKDCHKIDNTDFPNFVSDNSITGKGRDYEIITKKIQGNDGYVIWEELFVMILLTMLLFHMRVFVEKVGASIAGCSPYVAVIGMHLANFFQPNHNNIFTLLGKGVGMVIQGIQAQVSPNIGSLAARAIPHSFLEKTAIGRGVLAVGKGVSGAYSVAEWATGAESDITRKYREKEAFRGLHLAQATIGQTLSDLSPDNLVTAGLKHQYDKMLGVTDQGIFKCGINAYSTQLQRLKDDIYGRKNPDAPDSQKNKDDGDDTNPFQLPDDEKRKVGGDDGGPDSGSDGDSSPDDHLYASIDNESIYSEIDDSILGNRAVIEGSETYASVLNEATAGGHGHERSESDAMGNLYEEINDSFKQEVRALDDTGGSADTRPADPVSFDGDNYSNASTVTPEEYGANAVNPNAEGDSWGGTGDNATSNVAPGDRQTGGFDDNFISTDRVDGVLSDQNASELTGEDGYLTSVDAQGAVNNLGFDEDPNVFENPIYTPGGESHSGFDDNVVPGDRQTGAFDDNFISTDRVDGVLSDQAYESSNASELTDEDGYLTSADAQGAVNNLGFDEEDSATHQEQLDENNYLLVSDSEGSMSGYSSGSESIYEEIPGSSPPPVDKIEEYSEEEENADIAAVAASSFDVVSEDPAALPNRPENLTDTESSSDDSDGESPAKGEGNNSKSSWSSFNSEGPPGTPGGLQPGVEDGSPDKSSDEKKGKKKKKTGWGDEGEDEGSTLD